MFLGSINSRSVERPDTSNSKMAFACPKLAPTKVQRITFIVRRVHRPTLFLEFSRTFLLTGFLFREVHYKLAALTVIAIVVLIVIQILTMGILKIGKGSNNTS